MMDREFREMTDGQLEAEWLEIEARSKEPGGFFVVRALYILRERIRRLEQRRE